MERFFCTASHTLNHSATTATAAAGKRVDSRRWRPVRTSPQDSSISLQAAPRATSSPKTTGVGGILLMKWGNKRGEKSLSRARQLLPCVLVQLEWPQTEVIPQGAQPRHQLRYCSNDWIICLGRSSPEVLRSSTLPSLTPRSSQLNRELRCAALLRAHLLILQ